MKLSTKLHLEVSFASKSSIDMVEKAGGTVTCVHFNKLALRALIKPFRFDILPRRARPNPKIMDYYLDRTKAGYLSPEVLFIIIILIIQSYNLIHIINYFILHFHRFKLET